MMRSDSKRERRRQEQERDTQTHRHTDTQTHRHTDTQDNESLLGGSSTTSSSLGEIHPFLELNYVHLLMGAGRGGRVGGWGQGGNDVMGNDNNNNNNTMSWVDIILSGGQRQECSQ